jgi:LmbE family N-acetylglucosaminyl deacetylase
MVIVAHPDDADFGPAASVARWVGEGTVAHLVCCTSGDAGADDPRTDPLELARRREAEQRSAARLIGYAGVTFLHRPDGALENDLALREQLVRLIRAFRPDSVLTPDPTVIVHDDGYIQHTDHRAAAMAAVDAVYPAARNAMAFPHLAIDEGLEPHAVDRVILFWTPSPNAWVDVSAHLERKLAALREHASQIRDLEALEGRMRERAAHEGQVIGVEAAESFRVIELA